MFKLYIYFLIHLCKSQKNYIQRENNRIDALQSNQIFTLVVSSSNYYHHHENHHHRNHYQFHYQNYFSITANIPFHSDGNSNDKHQHSHFHYRPPFREK